MAMEAAVRRCNIRAGAEDISYGIKTTAAVQSTEFRRNNRQGTFPGPCSAAGKCGDILRKIPISITRTPILAQILALYITLSLITPTYHTL
jgi:hypothetical protein